jgi:hypothetical protein
MDAELTNNIILIIFVVVVGFLALISLMAVYVFIRYGQNKALTTITTLAFGTVFSIGVLTAFITLQKLF